MHVEESEMIGDGWGRADEAYHDIDEAYHDTPSML